MKVELGFNELFCCFLNVAHRLVFLFTEGMMAGAGITCCVFQGVTMDGSIKCRGRVGEEGD